MVRSAICCNAKLEKLLSMCGFALGLKNVHVVCAPEMKTMLGDTVTFAFVQR